MLEKSLPLVHLHHSLLIVPRDHLLIDHLLNLLSRHVQRHIERERLGTLNLIALIVHVTQAGMCQCLIHRNSLIGINLQHLVQQIDGQGIGPWEQLLKIDSGIEDVGIVISVVLEAGDRALHLRQVHRCSTLSQYEIQLVLEIGPAHKDLSLGTREQLGQYATDAPNVNGLVQLVPKEYDLWCTVPPSNDILGLVGILAMDHAARQAKVTNHDIDVLTQQNVLWLDVSVYNGGRVHVLETAQYLMHKVLDGLIRERLIILAHQTIQVKVHQIGHNVHVLKRVKTRWENQVIQANNL